MSPLDARQRMLVFKLGAEIEKKDWLDQLVSLIIESNCCADTVSLSLIFLTALVCFERFSFVSKPNVQGRPIYFGVASRLSSEFSVVS